MVFVLWMLSLEYRLLAQCLNFTPWIQSSVQCLRRYTKTNLSKYSKHNLKWAGKKIGVTIFPSRWSKICGRTKDKMNQIIVNHVQKVCKIYSSSSVWFYGVSIVYLFVFSWFHLLRDLVNGVFMHRQYVWRHNPANIK